MKTKDEHINFWIEQANDDWNAVDTLFKGRNFLQSLFFAHQVIEKICIAFWIKFNQGNIPPKTHDLDLLLSSTPLEIPEEKSEFMISLNKFQLEDRHPDYLIQIQKICNEQYTKKIIETTGQLRSWFLAKLP
ncbi:MAG: HEPN domain-containing protein [FCB group bacterium]|jgi:HEPN domain-containing protein